MKNLKISVKLLIAFGTILIATLALGITALVSIQTLDKIAEEYATRSIPSINYLWTARRAVQATEKMALEATIVMTPEELEATENSMLEERGSLDQALKDLLAVSPQYQKQVDSIQAELANVTAFRKQLLEEAHKFTTEGNARAYEIYKTDYHDSFEKARLAMVSLTEDVDNQIAEDYSAAQRTRNIAIAITICIFVIAIVVIVIFINVLIQQIVVPVRTLEHAATLVAQGNLDTEVDYHSEDEIGLLSNSIRTLISVLKNIINDVDYLLDQMAGGNFTVHTQAEKDLYNGMKTTACR